MAGIELRGIEGRFIGAEVCERARVHGVVLRPLGDVVVWMPPLTISRDEVTLLETATRAAILDAAERIFARDGWGAATLATSDSR